MSQIFSVPTFQIIYLEPQAEKAIKQEFYLTTKEKYCR